MNDTMMLFRSHCLKYYYYKKKLHRFEMALIYLLWPLWKT